METAKAGEKYGMSKLVESQVLAIKLRLNGGESQRSIARDLGVVQSAIWKIKNGITWNHLNVGGI